MCGRLTIVQHSFQGVQDLLESGPILWAHDGNHGNTVSARTVYYQPTLGSAAQHFLMRLANWEGQELGRVSRWVGERKRKKERERGRKRRKGDERGREGGEYGHRSVQSNIVLLQFLL